MAQSLYKMTITTRMHDIDAAGVVFFARIFYYIHDAYENLLNSHQQSISSLLNADFILPISHTEADYKAPIFLNEELSLKIFIKDIRENEFSLNYHFVDRSEKIKATAITRHICLDALSRHRKKLPDSILRILKYSCPT